MNIIDTKTNTDDNFYLQLELFSNKEGYSNIWFPEVLRKLLTDHAEIKRRALLLPLLLRGNFQSAPGAVGIMLKETQLVEQTKGSWWSKYCVV